MRLRECDACDDQIAESELGHVGGASWVELSDGAGTWLADACGPVCAQVLMGEHIQAMTELRAVKA